MKKLLLLATLSLVFGNAFANTSMEHWEFETIKVSGDAVTFIHAANHFYQDPGKTIVLRGQAGSNCLLLLNQIKDNDVAKQTFRVTSNGCSSQIRRIGR